MLLRDMGCLPVTWEKLPILRRGEPGSHVDRRLVTGELRVMLRLLLPLPLDDVSSLPRRRLLFSMIKDTTIRARAATLPTTGAAIQALLVAPLLSRAAASVVATGAEKAPVMLLGNRKVAWLDDGASGSGNKREEVSAAVGTALMDVEDAGVAATGVVATGVGDPPGGVKNTTPPLLPGSAAGGVATADALVSTGAGAGAGAAAVVGAGEGATAGGEAAGDAGAAGARAALDSMAESMVESGATLALSVTADLR